MSCKINNLNFCHISAETWTPRVLTFSDPENEVDITQDAFEYIVKNTLSGKEKVFTIDEGLEFLQNDKLIIHDPELPIGTYFHRLIWTKDGKKTIVFEGALTVQRYGSERNCNSNKNLGMGCDEKINIELNESNVIIRGATIDVDSVETLEAGEPATVENVGTPENVKLKFGIPKGERGWSPLITIESDGQEREVLKLVGYTGGQGEEPTENVGKYLSESGFVDDKTNATNVKGMKGDTGESGQPKGYITPYNTEGELNDLEEGFYYASESGNYAYGLEVEEGNLVIFQKVASEGNESDWEVAAIVNIPAAEVVDDLESESRTDALSAKQGKNLNQNLKSISTLEYRNLFDKNNIQEGRLINNNHHISGGEGWAVSDWIKVEPGQTYTLSGEFGRQQDIIFFEEYGENVNPVDFVPTPTSTTIFTVPENGSYLVFNLKSDANPNFDLVQLTKGSGVFPYTEYNDPVYSIKDKFDNVKNTVVIDTETKSYENLVKTHIEGRELIRGFTLTTSVRNVFNEKSVWLDGTLIKTGTDETAPYRINNKTIGANHDAGASNQDIFRKLYVDGELINKNKGEFSFKNSFTIKETYDLIDTSNGDILANITYAVEFTESADIWYTEIVGVKQVPLKDIMFIMSSRPIGPYLLHIPNTIPFDSIAVPGHEFDFEQGEDTENMNFESRISITKDMVKENKTVDRCFFINKQNDFGYAIGFLPVQNASPDVRPYNASVKYMQISDVGNKIYMSGIDAGSSINTLNTGDCYSVIGYKAFCTRVQEDLYSFIIESKEGIYCFFDFKDYQGAHKFELPNRLLGSDIDIFDKTDNIDVHSLNYSGFVYVEVSDDNPGHLIIRKK